MKRIAIVIDSRQFTSAAVEYACYLAMLNHSKLVGLFVKEREVSQIHHVHSSDSYMDATKSIAEKRKSISMDVDQAVHYFLKICEGKQIQTEVFVMGKANDNDGQAIEDVVTESRFMDLLVIDPGMNLHEWQEEPPSHFLKEILSRSECPVMLPPLHFTKTKEIVFCYDGSASCVFAMKQFTYLFPQLYNTKLTLLSITDSGKAKEKLRIENWLQDHYSILEAEIAESMVGSELFTYLLTKTDVTIVMGAYGRSVLSQFFRKSAADQLIRIINLPLFIAHR